MKRRILRIIALLAVALIVAWCLELAIPKHQYFEARAGVLESQRLVASSAGDEIHETVQLLASTGLKVDMRVLRPPTIVGERLPVVLVLGGQRTGKDAVDLVGDADGMAFAAIDYPYSGDPSLDGFWDSMFAVPDVQNAFLDSPAALLLARQWLASQAWADPDRIELVGVSLGVPFVAAAGAVDRRFSRVWLLHGGADNTSWVAHAGRRKIENGFLRRLAARSLLFLVYGNSFDTVAWVEETSPRPVVVVAARGDDYVPPEAQKPFERLAMRAHVELIWTEGRHIEPDREIELQQLLEIVLGRVLNTADRSTESVPTRP